MYQWMVHARQQDVIFKSVRPFSVAFNAMTLIVCIHRAVQLLDGNVGFHFSEPFSQDIARNKAYHLIKIILDDYAKESRHPALKHSFGYVEMLRVVTFFAFPVLKLDFLVSGLRIEEYRCTNVEELGSSGIACEREY
jgi:hypothetical protein